ncbi:amino acid permease [Fodinicola feengrottensis]|uniref:Amino acid permease n=1 Tax=Fodinicola feengrottensis TaxID=435914 RepID=A0ABN2G5N2_9ACTN
MPDPTSTDTDDLAGFGYHQRLSRTLGSFSSFAAGFSYISILTGMFQLFGFGYGFGGPGLFWTWLFVLAGQFAVALCFAELGARFPIAGSVYQWSKQLAGRAGAWMAGWAMLVGSIVTVAAVSIALQIVLPPIWSGFQVFTDNTVNAVFLGCCLLIVTTIINILGVKVISRVNNIGVFVELVGAVAIIVLLLFSARRGPDVVLHTQNAGQGLPGYGVFGYGAALVVAVIMPAYVMFGFDTASSLAEETKEPRRRVPRAILNALAAAGIAGALLLLFALMASPTLDLAALQKGGLPLVLESALGPTVAKLLLVDVAIAISVCTLAIHTASIRIIFSMARDNNLPFSAGLAHVSAHRRSPVVPAIVVGVVAALILLVNIGTPQIFTLVTSVSIVIVYVAYLLVTVPLLRKRLRGWPPDGPASGLFGLGRFGLAINIVAVCYGAFMAVNLVWPREAIYGAGGYAWGGLIFVVVVLGVGAIYYFTVQRRRTFTVLTEHRAVAGALPIAAED